MSMNIVGRGYTSTPVKTIKPQSYNGVRSTGFKGVNVIVGGDTHINKTTIVNVDSGGGCCEGKKSSWADKLVGGLTLATGLVGLGGMIASLFGGKDNVEGTEDQGAPENPDNNPTEPAKDDTGTNKTLFGGMLQGVTITAKAPEGVKVKPFESNLPEDINQAASELQSMYSGIVKDISLEKQSDGTYKVTFTFPDTLKYGGDTAAITANSIKTSDDLDKALDKAMTQLYTGNTSSNPFAPKTETE